MSLPKKTENKLRNLVRQVRKEIDNEQRLFLLEGGPTFFKAIGGWLDANEVTDPKHLHSALFILWTLTSPENEADFVRLLGRYGDHSSEMVRSYCLILLTLLIARLEHRGQGRRQELNLLRRRILRRGVSAESVAIANKVSDHDLPDKGVGTPG